MRRIAVAAVVLVALAGCGDDDGSAAKTTTIEVTSTEYAFDAPATVALTGLAEIKLSNPGKEPHQAALLKLGGGKTMADLTAFLSAPSGAAPGGPPPFSVGGGPAVVAPGGDAVVTQALGAGQYVFMCFVPAPDGAPHFAKGMVKEITLTGGTSAGTTLPEGLDATARDFSYDLPAIAAGSVTIRAKNAGTQDHEFVVGRVADGKAAADALTWITAPQGPPPFVDVGGVIVARFGGEGAFTIDYTPGTYIFFCNIPDDATGVAHAKKGMFAEVMVT